MQLKPYTVLLLYPDYLADDFGSDTYLAWVEAESAAAAITEGQRQALSANSAHYDDPDDVIEDYFDDWGALFVCEGHHKDLSQGE